MTPTKMHSSMINIYNPNGTILIKDIPLTTSSVHERELMKSDFIRLSWTDTEYKEIGAGSYVVIDGVNYALLSNYKPQSRTEAEYAYEPRFEHPMMILAHTPCLFRTNNAVGSSIDETDWTVTGNLGTTVQGILNAIDLQLGTEFKYVLLGNDFKASATCSFNGVDIWSALAEVASQFGTEFHVDWAKDTIYFGEISLGESVTLEEGKNVNVATISEQREPYANCFSVRGGTRNITTETASGNNVETDTRLSLQGYTDPNGHIYGSESVIDRRNSGEPKLTKILFFDDIYPKLDLYAYNVRTRLRRLRDEQTGEYIPNSYDEETGEVKDYKMYAIYYMRLAYKDKATGRWQDYKLSSEEDVVSGKKLMCSFEPNEQGTHSALAGRKFELRYHFEDKTIAPDADIDDTGIEVKTGDYEILFQKEGDLIIPNITTLAPWGEDKPSESSDKVVLFNIVMSGNYITSAKAELYAEAVKEIERLSKDRSNYTMRSNPVTFKDRLAIGQKVTYKSVAGYTLMTRVTKLVEQLDIESDVEITVGNGVVRGNTETLKTEVKSANDGVNAMSAVSQAASSLSQSLQNAQNSLMEAMSRYTKMWQFDEKEPNTIWSPYTAYALGGLSALGKGHGGSGGGGILVDIIEATGANAVVDAVFEENKLTLKKGYIEGGSGGGGGMTATVSGTGNAVTRAEIVGNSLNLTLGQIREGHTDAAINGLIEGCLNSKDYINGQDLSRALGLYVQKASLDETLKLYAKKDEIKVGGYIGRTAVQDTQKEQNLEGIGHAYLSGNVYVNSYNVLDLTDDNLHLNYGKKDVDKASVVVWSKRLYIGGTTQYIEIDKEGNFHFSHGMYSDSFASALGKGKDGTGGGGVMRFSELVDVQEQGTPTTNQVWGKTSGGYGWLTIPEGLTWDEIKGETDKLYLGKKETAYRALQADYLTTTRTLWGQNFNGSQNVSGRMTGVGDIYMQGGIYMNNADVLASAGGALYIGNGTRGTGKTQIAGNGIELRNSANTLMVQMTDVGNVGIGLSGSSILDKLHVQGRVRASLTTATDTYFDVQNTLGRMSFMVSDKGIKGLYDRNNGAWAVATNGTNTWMALGNVGIGTDDPKYKLDVNGSLNVDGDIRTSRYFDLVYPTYGGARMFVQVGKENGVVTSKEFNISPIEPDGTLKWDYKILTYDFIGHGITIGRDNNSYLSEVIIPGNLVAKKSVFIGGKSGVELKYDTTNNALMISKTVYSVQGVSGLGAGAASSAGITFTNALTLNGGLTVNSASNFTKSITVSDIQLVAPGKVGSTSGLILGDGEAPMEMTGDVIVKDSIKVGESGTTISKIAVAYEDGAYYLKITTNSAGTKSVKLT